VDRPELTQGANQELNILESVDALKSQTVEPHSYSGGPDSAHSRYQPGTPQIQVPLSL